MQFIKNKLSGTVWLYVSFTLMLATLLIWTSVRTLRETPSREVGLEIPDQGWITFKLKRYSDCQSGELQQPRFIR
jgi:uncharacterized metal-binding protein